MHSLNNEPCPICGETRSEPFHETTYPEHSYPGSFLLRKCAGCKLLFNSPRLDEKELAALYGRSYYFFRRSDAREFDRAARMVLRTVALVADQTPEKRTLDIGSGRGYLPALLTKLGWNARGVEISADASTYARAKFHIEVFTGTIEDYVGSAQKQSFPLVTAIDVIEHVPDINRFVEAAASVVEPGGRLIVDTPNAGSKNIETEGVKWKGFNPFHIYLFNPDNLGRLLEKHGLQVEQRFTYGNIPASRAAKSKASELAAKMRSGLPPLAVSAAAKAYFAVRASGGHGATSENLSRATAAVQAGPTFPNSADAKEELAKDLGGDNVVVIARKPA